MKIVCCYPISSSIESADDDHSCDELGEESETYQWEDALTIFLDSILWYEILQTFCQTQIIVDTDKSHQIDSRIEKSKIAHTQCIGEEEFDDIARWHYQEEEDILSDWFADQFITEIIVGFKFHKHTKTKSKTRQRIGTIGEIGRAPNH